MAIVDEISRLCLVQPWLLDAQALEDLDELGAEPLGPRAGDLVLGSPGTAVHHSVRIIGPVEGI